MKSRILVAVLGVPVLIYVVLWAPSIVMMTALCLLAGVGSMELQQCVSGVKRSRLVSLSAIVSIFTVEWYYDRPEVVALLFLLEGVIIFCDAIFKGGKIKFQQIMAALTGLICSYPFSSASPATPSPISPASPWADTSWPPRSALRKPWRAPSAVLRATWSAACSLLTSWTVGSAPPWFCCL